MDDTGCDRFGGAANFDDESGEIVPAGGRETLRAKKPIATPTKMARMVVKSDTGAIEPTKEDNQRREPTRVRPAGNRVG